MRMYKKGISIILVMLMKLGGMSGLDHVFRETWTATVLKSRISTISYGG